MSRSAKAPTPMHRVLIALHTSYAQSMTVHDIQKALNDDTPYRVHGLLSRLVAYGLVTVEFRKGTAHYTITRDGELTANLLIKFPDVYHDRTMNEVREIAVGSALKPRTNEEQQHVAKVYEALSRSPDGATPQAIVDVTGLPEGDVFRTLGMLLGAEHAREVSRNGVRCYAFTPAGKQAAMQNRASQ